MPPLETLALVIRPDGTVEESTHGLRGAACEEVTRGLEAALGEVTSREPTAERYESGADSAAPALAQRSLGDVA